MIEVKVKDNSQDALEKAIKEFSKKCNKDGFLKKARNRRYFKKPSQVQHEKNIARERHLELQRKKKKRKY